MGLKYRMRCRLDTACSSSNVRLKRWNWCRVCSDQRSKLWKLKGRRRRRFCLPKMPLKLALSYFIHFFFARFICRNMSHLRHPCEFWGRQISRSRWKFWMWLGWKIKWLKWRKYQFYKSSKSSSMEITFLSQGYIDCDSRFPSTASKVSWKAMLGLFGSNDLRNWNCTEMYWLMLYRCWGTQDKQSTAWGDSTCLCFRGMLWSCGTFWLIPVRRAEGTMDTSYTIQKCTNPRPLKA